MPEPLPPRRAQSASGALAWPGALWGAALVGALGFAVAPGPASPRAWAALAAVAAAAACVHVGLWRAAAGLARRGPPLADVGAAVAGGLLYAALALSLAKFVVAGAHLRFEDLWFLGRSAAQVRAEATGTERVWLLSLGLLPLAFAGALYLTLRPDRRRGTPPDARRGLVLAAAGALVLAALAGVSSEARRLVATALPESHTLLASVGDRRLPTPSGAPASGPGLAEPWRLGADARRWNVLVVMLESVPWKRAFGPEARPDSTPTLRALAAESIVFARAYAASTHSDYAQTSILASLHPRKGAGHDYFTVLDYPRTLFWDPLAANGWRTAVFSCQNEGWGNMIAFLSTPGLGALRHAPDWPSAPHRGAGAESKVYEETPVAAFVEWLDAEPGRPFAAYLNFQATHYPYEVPSGRSTPYPHLELDFPTTFLSYPGDKIGVMLDRFHNALAYADDQLGRVVDALRARGLLESTALLVVSDHGEAFYEHRLPTHGTTLHEEQVRTAMLLRLPDQAARTIEEPVSVLDAVPTIWRAAGWPAHGNFQGRGDLLEPGYRGAERPLLMTIQGMTREDGVVVGGWKYLLNWDRRERALFDLALDPDERRNLVADRPEEAARLDRELARGLEAQLAYYGRRGWESGSYPPPLP